MKFKINTKRTYKICPICHRLYTEEHNFCADESELVELIEVEFE